MASSNPFVTSPDDIPSNFKLGSKPDISTKILSTIEHDSEVQFKDNIPDSRKTHDELLEEDFRQSRDAIRELLAIKMKALEEYGELVSSTDSPRAYEVYSNMIDSAVDIPQKLIELYSKKNKSAETNSPPGQSTTIHNQQINMLSPVEVIRMLREGTTTNE